MISILKNVSSYKFRCPHFRLSMRLKDACSIICPTKERRGCPHFQSAGCAPLAWDKHYTTVRSGRGLQKDGQRMGPEVPAVFIQGPLRPAPYHHSPSFFSLNPCKSIYTLPFSLTSPAARMCLLFPCHSMWNSISSHIYMSSVQKLGGIYILHPLKQ